MVQKDTKGTVATSGVRVWRLLQVYPLIANSPAFKSFVVRTDDLFGLVSRIGWPEHEFVKVVDKTERA